MIRSIFPKTDEPRNKSQSTNRKLFQVVTDLRLWLRQQIAILEKHLLTILRALSDRADTELDIIFPGYTHMQRAQPVRWSHFLMSHAVAFKRDHERLRDVLADVDVMPLGSGAIAGNPLGINREYLASLLAFPKVSLNSIHAVADR